MHHSPTRRRAAVFAAALALPLLGGCAALDSVLPAVMSDATRVGDDAYAMRGDANAMLRTADGREVGRAMLTATATGTRVAVEVAGMAPGTYGMHIHETGRCDAPDFTTAGAHWNPGSRRHGTMNPMGAHAGDLPNITINANGRGGAAADLRGVTVAGTMDSVIDGNGAAIIIHAAPDDMRTDPSGNSGARIACGVIQRR